MDESEQYPVSPIWSRGPCYIRPESGLGAFPEAMDHAERQTSMLREVILQKGVNVKLTIPAAGGKAMI